MSSIPYSSDLNYVAKGSFGCVVKPGLPNKGEHNTNWEQFPKNVTKIFKTYTTYKKGINSTRKAYTIMGENNAHRIHKYKRQYTVRNLPNNIQKSCDFKNSNSIFATRLPNLGISFYDLNGNTAAIDKIHRISFIVILQQIYKVLEQVDKLQKVNYVHGDIRETNVMIDPSDGRISIIDFDWLLPKITFFTKFPLGFYNSPPETIVHKFIVQYTNISKDNIILFLKGHIPHMDEFKKNGILFLKTNVASTQNINKPILINTITTNVKYYDNILQEANAFDSYNRIRILFNEYFKTYDSYSIGYSLLYMMNILYPGALGKNISNDEMKDAIKGKLYDSLVEYNNEQISLISNIIYNVKKALQALCNIDVSKRSLIGDALKIVKEEINNLSASNAFKQVANTAKIAESALKAIPVPPPTPHTPSNVA